MRIILPIFFFGSIVVLSCSFIAIDEPSLSSSSVTKIPKSSSSSIDCSIISSSSNIGEDLCSDFDPDAEIEHYGKMKKQFCDERDGKKYVYVQIGEQIWMAENLNFDVCGSKCARPYSYSTTNEEVCDKFARLYDWSTALTICPDGWHLPSDAEWTALTDYAGGYDVAGTKLKATGGNWDCSQKTVELNKDYSMSDGYSCEGIKENTDDYGFSALPCGSHNGYSFIGRTTEKGVLWSSTEFQTEFQVYAYYRELFSYGNGIFRHYKGRKEFLSVRCVRD